MKQISLWLTACCALALLAACSTEVDAPTAAFETQAANQFDVERWSDRITCGNSFHCFISDVNNDGRDDILRVDEIGVTVDESYHSPWGGSYFDREYYDYIPDLSGDGSFHCSTEKVPSAGYRFKDTCAAGDFNNDGYADVVAFQNAGLGHSNTVTVTLGEQGERRFRPPEQWTQGFCNKPEEVCLTGDFNDDDRDDIIAFHHGAWGGSKTVFVYLSTGSSFSYPGHPWHADFCGAGETCAVGDVNGDKKDDIITFLRGPNAFGANGDVYVSLSTGSSFGPKQKWHKNICFNNHYCTVGDVNGDDFADLVTFTRNDRNGPSEPEVGVGPHEVYVALSYGKGFGGAIKRHDYFCNDFGGATCTVGQFTDDDKADILHTSGHVFGANPNKDTYVGESSIE